MFTALAASFCVFVVLNLIPGDPARLVAGPEATEEAYLRIREALGLDRPWPLRFIDWLSGALRGDFGVSLVYHREVGWLLGRGLTVTLPLAGMVLLLSLALSLPLGIAAAVRPGRVLDLLTAGLSQLGLSLPEFWLGILLALLLSVKLRLLPAGGFPGWGKPSAPGYLLLPALALAVPRAAYLARMVRGSLLGVLHEGYIRTARAKGLREARVLLVHALRPAAIPVITAAGLIGGQLLAGAVVVENVFYLPGLGRLALGGVMGRDIPLVEGIVLIASVLILSLNLLTDLAYGLLDPRIRYR